MIEQKIQQKLLQKLSPQQIQLIKMLEIPIMELEQRIKKELEENPALEEGSEEPDVIEDVFSDDNDEFNEESTENKEDQNNDDEPEQQEYSENEFSYEDYLSDDEQDDIPYYRLQDNNYNDELENINFNFSHQNSFIDNLKEQIGFLNLTPKQRSIAEYIIGNLDERGYLQRNIEQISDDMAFIFNIQTTLDEIEYVLSQVQTLDPPGIGARNIQESFIIQLKRKPQTPSVRNALLIVEKYFDEFMKKHYEKISSKLNLSNEELKEAINEIQHLIINPGTTLNDIYETAKNQVIPDFYVDIDEGEIRVSLNSKHFPELRISKSFQDMLKELETQAKINKKNKDKKQREAIQFARQKIDSARWFIDAIQQRQNTLLTTMQAIVQLQKDFFVEGDKSLLKPMILKDVSDITGYDISTISRVVSNKYVSTPHGVFPLKFFFSESMTTSNDEEISTHKIKEIIKKLIDNEDKTNPLTDEQIANELKNEGYQVARRTVAKYREQLKIPVARLRKEIKI